MSVSRSGEKSMEEQESLLDRPGVGERRAGTPCPHSSTGPWFSLPSSSTVTRLGADFWWLSLLLLLFLARLGLDVLAVFWTCTLPGSTRCLYTRLWTDVVWASRARQGDFRERKSYISTWGEVGSRRGGPPPCPCYYPRPRSRRPYQSSRR